MIHPTKDPIYVTSFQSFKLYLILNNAFKKGYDPIKYSWKINVKEQTFLKRKDYNFFVKLSKDYNIHEQHRLITISMLHDTTWIGDILSVDSLMFYRKYIARFNNIQELFRSDIHSLIIMCKSRNRQFRQLFLKEFDFPIFKILQNDSISYETFLLLDQYFNFIDELDKHNDFIWEQYQIKIKAYKKMLNINRQEVIDTLKEVMKLYY